MDVLELLGCIVLNYVVDKHRVIELSLSIQLMAVHKVNAELLKSKRLILLASLKSHIIEVAHYGKWSEKLSWRQRALLQECLSQLCTREDQGGGAEALGEPLSQGRKSL
jgi:hypothetical protein